MSGQIARGDDPLTPRRAQDTRSAPSAHHGNPAGSRGMVSDTLAVFQREM